MPSSLPDEVTQLLQDWAAGDQGAQEQLIPIVYDELRRLAHHYLAGESSRDLLETTALVHEAYLRLVDMEVEWQERRHFFGLAAQLMRNVLVDLARRRRADKRGGGETDLTLDAVVGAVVGPTPDMVDLDRALTHLEAMDARKARAVELRYFGGLTLAETAEFLGISNATVERDLKMARAWLARALGDQKHLRGEA